MNFDDFPYANFIQNARQPSIHAVRGKIQFLLQLTLFIIKDFDLKYNRKNIIFTESTTADIAKHPLLPSP